MPGAGGAHKFLFLDLTTFLNLLIVHFFSPTYFRHPTIDLTCCFKKDLDFIFISIISLFFFIIKESIVLIGLDAEQFEALKTDRSCVPFKKCDAFFISL